MPTGYYYEENTTQLEKAAKAGLQVYETEGVIESDGAGNISGIAIDNTPTENSDNLVKSGGIYSAIKNVADNAAPIITDTASGSIASFPDGADLLPLLSLISYINPVQDLHGQDNPYPAGGGKNLLPVTLANLKSLNTAGTWSDNVYTHRAITYTVVLDDGGNVIGIKTSGTTGSDDSSFMILGSITNANSLILTGCPSGGAQGTYKLRVGTTSDVFVGEDIGSGYTFTASEERVIKINFGNSTSGSGLTFYPMIRLSTESDATFAPYSNICPITGFTGTNIQVNGFNVWNEQWEVGGINSTTGQNQLDNSRIRSTDYICVKPSTSYYCTNASAVILRCYDINKSYIGGLSITDGVFTTQANCCYIRFQTQTTYGTTYNNDIAINYPSTETAYNPYSGETYSISWQTEAGTVYSANLNATTGVLTDIYGHTDLGTLDWSANGAANSKYRYKSNGIASLIKITTGVFNGACSRYKITTGGNTWSRVVGIGVGGVGEIYIYDPNYADSDQHEAFKTSLDGAQLVYELASYVTYQLTPTEVETLLGQNNIFNDTNGNIDVEYPADTKLFILKAIANA